MTKIEMLIDAINKQKREFVGFMGLSRYLFLSNEIDDLIQELDTLNSMKPKAFGKAMPNYGDLIVIESPPEQMAQMRIRTFDRDTVWMDGDVFYLLKKAECR